MNNPIKKLKDMPLMLKATIVFAIMLAAILALFLALVRKSEVLKGTDGGKNDK